MLDSHTHTNFSSDSQMSLDELISTGIGLKLRYLAVTDHFDGDFLHCLNTKNVAQLDLPAYAEAVLAAKSMYEGRLNLAFGIEYGYSPLSDDYTTSRLADYPFDVIINSVHTVNRMDVYVRSYYEGKSKNQMFVPYLKTVRESLDAKAPYDIVGHIGYLARNSQLKFTYLDYPDYFDDILKTIIQKGKCLEVNSHIKFCGAACLPTPDIIKRYFELGGELITFSSDGHQPHRVADRYNQVSELVKAIGFKYYTVYKERKPEMLAI